MDARAGGTMLHVVKHAADRTMFLTHDDVRHIARTWGLEGKACSLDTHPGTSNWVQKAGGLPDYICRIAKHLVEKGRPVGEAIAAAVNAVKKACATGDLNFPGVQQENAGSRAEACAAVAEWESKKAKARAS